MAIQPTPCLNEILQQENHLRMLLCCRYYDCARQYGPKQYKLSMSRRIETYHQLKNVDKAWYHDQILILFTK